MSLTSPITLLESVAPRNLGGTIVALANSDDGGSETVRWDGKTWVQKPGYFRKYDSGLASDKSRNKRYGGFAAVVRYAYLGNYDADWDARNVWKAYEQAE